MKVPEERIWKQLFHLASDAESRGDLETAMSYARAALGRARGLCRSSKQDLILNIMYLADLLSTMNEFEESISLYIEAIALARKLNVNDDAKESLPTAHTSKDLNSGSRDLLIGLCLRNLSEILQKTGHEDEALHCSFESRKSILESLRVISSDKKSGFLQDRKASEF